MHIKTKRPFQNEKVPYQNDTVFSYKLRFAIEDYRLTTIAHTHNSPLQKKGIIIKNQ